MTGAVYRQGTDVGVGQPIVNSRPRFCIIGGAKNAASLGAHEDMATGVCGQRDAVAPLWTIGLGPEILATCWEPAWSHAGLNEICT